MFKAVSLPTMSKPEAKRNRNTSVHHLYCIVISGDPPSSLNYQQERHFAPTLLTKNQVLQLAKVMWLAMVETTFSVPFHILTS